MEIRRKYNVEIPHSSFQSGLGHDKPPEAPKSTLNRAVLYPFGATLYEGVSLQGYPAVDCHLNTSSNIGYSDFEEIAEHSSLFNSLGAGSNTSTYISALENLYAGDLSLAELRHKIQAVQ